MNYISLIAIVIALSIPTPPVSVDSAPYKYSDKSSQSRFKPKKELNLAKVLPTKQKPKQAVSGKLDGSLNWAALRDCESGGNYQSNSNPIYKGAYQFDQQTWDGYAVNEWRGKSPHLAPPAVQDAAAQRLYDARGADPWPICGKLL